MNKIILLYIQVFLLVFVFVLSTSAQEPFNRKKTLKEVRASIKSANYAQAETLLNKAITSFQEAKQDVEFYSLLMNVEHNLADAENRKIFLNSNPDTAKYFLYIYKVYKVGLSCDSLDRLPDEKGRLKLHYTSGISELLQFYRNNIKSAGKFFYKKQKYSDAFRYFDLFLQTINNVLITFPKNINPNSDSLDIARLAVHSAFNASEYKNVMKYLPKVIKDTTNYAAFCHIGSKSLMELGDTLRAIDFLYKGWKADPGREYFYITLVNYYIDRLQYDKAYEIVDTQLSGNPTNRRLWYIKGKCQQCMDSLDSAIVSYERAILILDSDAQSYSSIGNIYVIKAHQAYNTSDYKIGTNAYTRAKRQQTEYYKKALDNFELARKYAPDNTSLWLTGLSEVYFKLNMGKELKALEKIFPSKTK